MGFNKVFCLETGRFLDKRRLIILLVFYLLVIYFIQSGIYQYKSNLEEIKRFQEFEKARIEHFQYYDQYGTYGFRVLYIPGPLSAFFNNAGIFTANLNAFIDAGERMKIYEPFKGKDAFIGYSSVFLNLSGFLTLFGSLLALFYGLEAYKDKDFLKLLDSVAGSRKKLFFSILATRLILLLGCCFIITISSGFLFIVNGINVNIGNLSVYCVVVFLMMGVFLLAGVFAGSLRKKQGGLVAVFSVWLLLVFGLPAIVGKIVYNRANSMVSAYEMEMDTFKLMMSIERKAKEQAGQMKRDNTNTKIRQKLYEYFWNNEFKQIFAHEESMIRDMREIVTLHHNLSLIFPTSYFLSVNNEISGRGYENLINFYEYVLSHKKGFVQFYAEKSFYSGEKKVVPYLKENENIFYASSLLPQNYVFGLVFSVFWMLLFLFFSWVSFNRLLDGPQSKEQKSSASTEWTPDDFKENKTTVVLTSNPVYLSRFITNLKRQEKSFFYVPLPDSLPGDIKIESLFSFFNMPVPEKLALGSGHYINDLEMDNKALILLELTGLFDREFIVFDRFLSGLSDGFCEHFATVLEDMKKGRKIVYFSNSFFAATRFEDEINKDPADNFSF